MKQGNQQAFLQCGPSRHPQQNQGDKEGLQRERDLVCPAIHIPIIHTSHLLPRNVVVQSREVLLADMGVFPQHCFEWLCNSSQTQRCSKNQRPLPCISVPPWGQLHCLRKAHYIASSLYSLGLISQFGTLNPPYAFSYQATFTSFLKSNCLCLL